MREEEYESQWISTRTSKRKTESWMARDTLWKVRANDGYVHWVEKWSGLAVGRAADCVSWAQWPCMHGTGHWSIFNLARQRHIGRQWQDTGSTSFPHYATNLAQLTEPKGNIRQLPKCTQLFIGSERNCLLSVLSSLQPKLMASCCEQFSCTGSLPLPVGISFSC